MIAGATCSCKESTYGLVSSVYDEIYVNVEDDVVIFPLDFNYILFDVPSDFDYEIQLKGVINKKEKTIVCNNGIEFSIYFFADEFFTIEYGEQVFNFGNIKFSKLEL